jgi:hypothetical protein
MAGFATEAEVKTPGAKKLPAAKLSPMAMTTMKMTAGSLMAEPAEEKVACSQSSREASIKLIQPI